MASGEKGAGDCDGPNGSVLSSVASAGRTTDRHSMRDSDVDTHRSLAGGVLCRSPFAAAFSPPRRFDASTLRQSLTTVMTLHTLGLLERLTHKPTLSWDAEISKPDPRIFQGACKACEEESGEGVIMVGDELVA